MKETDDLSIFSGLELEEPSAETDRAIVARSRDRRFRSLDSGPSALPIAALLAVAAAAVVVFGVFSTRDLMPPGTSDSLPSPGGVASEAADFVAEVRGLRADLLSLRDRTPEIPAARAHLRDEVERRIALCLADLSVVEARAVRLGGPAD